MQTGLFSLPKKLPSLPYATEWGRHKETTHRCPDGVFENFGQLKCLIPKDLRGRLKKKQFTKRMYSWWQKILAYFYSYYRVWRTPGKNFLGLGVFVDNYCGSYQIISVTLKRFLKTQSFGIKAILPVNKILWLFLVVLLIMTNDREQFRRVQKNFLTNIVQVIRSFP